jgi:hypothetical protein
MTTKFTNGAGTVPDMASRRVVASFATYTEAERAVDLLADNKFPVERTAIVGHGLKLVEQVTGRMDYGKAALRGALSGAFVGVLIGWLFGAFNWFDPVVASGWLVLDGLWFGAVVGALVGLLIHALSGGRRDFESFGSLRAEPTTSSSTKRSRTRPRVSSRAAASSLLRPSSPLSRRPSSSPLRPTASGLALVAATRTCRPRKRRSR